MDHGYVPGVGLLLILVDAFSGWPEAIPVPNREASTVRRVLQVIFSRNGVPRVLVSDNAAEFTDQKLDEWLTRIGCRSIKIPPYHPQSNGIAERMVQTVKRGLKAYKRDGTTFESYLARLLLSYRSIPHAGRNKSPSALMGRQIRSPMTTAFSTNESLWYERTGHSPVEAFYVVQNGNNTATIVHGKNDTPVLAHMDQLRRRENVEDEITNVEELNTPNRVDERLVEEAEDVPQLVRRSNRCNKGVPPDRYGLGGEM